MFYCVCLFMGSGSELWVSATEPHPQPIRISIKNLLEFCHTNWSMLLEMTQPTGWVLDVPKSFLFVSFFFKPVVLTFHFTLSFRDLIVSWITSKHPPVSGTHGCARVHSSEMEDRDRWMTGFQALQRRFDLGCEPLWSTPILSIWWCPQGSEASQFIDQYAFLWREEYSFLYRPHRMYTVPQ